MKSHGHLLIHAIKIGETIMQKTIYQQAPNLYNAQKMFRRLFARRENTEPTAIRHYKRLTVLYKFIYRNPSMFNQGDQLIEICLDQYENGVTVLARLTYQEIGERIKLNLDEKTERQYLQSLFSVEHQ